MKPTGTTHGPPARAAPVSSSTGTPRHNADSPRVASRRNCRCRSMFSSCTWNSPEGKSPSNGVAMRLPEPVVKLERTTILPLNRSGILASPCANLILPLNRSDDLALPIADLTLPFLLLNWSGGLASPCADFS